MKITAWNCQMAFRNDSQKLIDSFGPDIAIITECENEERLKNIQFKDIVWKGDNLNKGIGIFSFSNDYQVELHSNYNKEIKDVIPIRVTGNKEFTLFACWAKKELNYIFGITDSLEKYMKSISGDILIAGDLNANQIWRESKDKGYTKFMAMLKKKEIHSCYHEWTKEEHGKETKNTHFTHRDSARGFHIDYCLASKKLLEQMTDVKVPEFNDWIDYSDHVPLNVIFS